MVQSNGDLLYEGEIVEYRVSPMTATSDLNAAQNRLSISVNVSFQNFKKEENRCILFEMYQEEKNTFKRRQLTV